MSHKILSVALLALAISTSNTYAGWVTTNTIDVFVGDPIYEDSAHGSSFLAVDDGTGGFTQNLNAAPVGAHYLLLGSIFPGGTFDVNNPSSFGSTWFQVTSANPNARIGTWTCQGYIIHHDNAGTDLGGYSAIPTPVGVPKEKEFVHWNFDFFGPNHDDTDDFTILTVGILRGHNKTNPLASGALKVIGSTLASQNNQNTPPQIMNFNFYADPVSGATVGRMVFDHPIQIFVSTTRRATQPQAVSKGKK